MAYKSIDHHITTRSKMLAHKVPQIYQSFAPDLKIRTFYVTKFQIPFWLQYSPSKESFIDVMAYKSIDHHITTRSKMLTHKVPQIYQSFAPDLKIRTFYVTKFQIPQHILIVSGNYMNPLSGHVLFSNLHI